MKQDPNHINRGLLKLPDLEESLQCLIRGKSDVVLYGNKSSGKTQLATSILNEVVGPQNYIRIMSIFASDRDSLLYLLGDELLKLIKNISSNFMMDNKKGTPTFAKEDQVQSLECWVKRFNKFIKENEEFFGKLRHIYIFFDNIEDIHLTGSNFRDLYFAFKREIKIIKFSFLFCGVCHKNQYFSIQEPFRSIPTFVMPLPDIRIAIKAALEESAIYQKSVSAVNTKNEKLVSEFKRLVNHIEFKLYIDFESSEYQLENVYLMSKSFISHVHEFVKDDHTNVSKWLSKNNQDHENELLHKLKVIGEINNFTSEPSEGSTNFFKENYPNLLMSSLFMANGYSESDDHKRFIDMKKTSSKNGAAGKQKILTKVMSQKRFKREMKNQKHYSQRIISIAEVLEEQSEGTGFFGEKQKVHHSLDFYGCLEYLRDEGEIGFYGKNNGNYGGRVYGEKCKEGEVKDFLKKTGLEYSQFSDKD